MKLLGKDSHLSCFWLKIWLLTPLLLIISVSINEALLKLAKHEPSIISDADLFCTAYSQVKNFGENDTVFLGASRMQTGLDLEVWKQQSPDIKAVMLAQSGRGTSYPVFLDLVENTDFNGTVVIDETEGTLVSQEKDQQAFVESCQQFSLDDRINRQISTALQSVFVFLNPQSSSFRLWGNLLVDHELPEPFYTKTLSDRQQLVDYERADSTALKTLVQSRLEGVDKGIGEQPSIADWIVRTQHWQSSIQTFQNRGGSVIFVRMPVSQSRWRFEEKSYPPDGYWKAFVTKNEVQSVHFSEYLELSDLELADTSHLGFQHKTDFTNSLLEILNKPHRSDVGSRESESESSL